MNFKNTSLAIATFSLAAMTGIVHAQKVDLVNNEKEILVFRGLIRPDNISPNNTILSQYVADAQIYLVGNGVLDDKQSPGWLVRFLDKAWPF